MRGPLPLLVRFDPQRLDGAAVRDTDEQQPPCRGLRYGLGFWLHQSRDAVMLEGSDAGVSFRTVHDPVGGFTHTVLSNTTSGAWPITRHLDEFLTP
jgi:hypothetical protein